MLAIKLCSAQLSHQDGAMTAGPHAARVTQTGSQKIAWNVFTQVPSVSSCGKQYKTPTAWQTTKSIRILPGLLKDKRIEMLVVTLLHELPLQTLITSVISSSFQFAFPTSQQSCFPVLGRQSVVLHTRPLIPVFQLLVGISRRVSTVHKGAPM